VSREVGRLFFPYGVLFMPWPMIDSGNGWGVEDAAHDAGACRKRLQKIVVSPMPI
jgi:hypothetical protein